MYNQKPVQHSSFFKIDIKHVEPKIGGVRLCLNKHITRIIAG
jgi:hypothetical protein